MSGRGRGYCAVNVSDNGENPVAGSGFGRGGGRGLRNCFYATGLPGWRRANRGMPAFGGRVRACSNDQALAVLKEQAGYFQEELSAVQARIQDLEAKSAEAK
ncbi:MAG: DUF5320 domain-containing protein [Candidatus Omnitrophica bacterium]|nr:DUF5320 domain-containing protein [Candidatus Omnitrophota bacterium]